MSKRDGGHAFPNITPDMNVDGGPGMSLRDYFAIRATPEDINRHRGRYKEFSGEVHYKRSHEEARWVFADAMLAAREDS